MGESEGCASEVGSGEGGADESRDVEVAVAEVGSREVGGVEVRAGEPCPSHVQSDELMVGPVGPVAPRP